MSSFTGSSRGGIFSQQEIDNTQLQLKLQEQQLKNALAKTKEVGSGGSGAVDMEALARAIAAAKGASASAGGSGGGSDGASDTQRFEWQRTLQSDKAGQQKDAAAQAADLEAERRRAAAALALSRVSAFR